MTMYRHARDDGGASARVIPALALALLMIVATAATAQEPGDSGPDAADERVSVVTNGWVDVRDVLTTLAAQNDYGLQIAPDVDGNVNIHLEDVTLTQALDALLKPAELNYEVADDVIVVYRRGLTTEWFTFDYPVTERVGRGELEISVSSEGTTAGSTGGSDSGEGQNRSHVTSMATMSVWPQVMRSLETLVFQGSVPQGAGGAGGQDAAATNLADAEGRSLVVNPMAGLIQVTAERDRVHRVEGFLERLKDSLQRQVAIQVQILEVYLDEDTQTGINWETLTGGDTETSLHTFNETSNIADSYFQFVVDSRDFRGVLQAISTSGNVKTVSSPRVTTLNNQKAVVRVVTEEVYYVSEVEPAVITNGVATEPITNYRPATIPVGVVLDVTPQVGRDGVITLNVHPTISNIVGVAESPNEDSVPVLSIRELDTVGKVRQGSTLVIAGLMSERKNVTRSGIPLLKDLPVLGALFGQTRDRKVDVELVMLITPEILEGGESDELTTSVRAKLDD